MLVLERHVVSNGHDVWSDNSLIVQTNRKRVSFRVVFGDGDLFFFLNSFFYVVRSVLRSDLLTSSGISEEEPSVTNF